MNYCVIGATGKTGTEITRLLLSKGHGVTVLVRDPQRLSITHGNLKVITGDVRQGPELQEALVGVDAVIVALGGGQSLAKTDIRTLGTARVIEAIKATPIRRLIVISAMGTGESWKDLSLFNRFFYITLLANAKADHEGQETLVRNSGLDWTILRPSGLTDGPGSQSFAMGSGIRGKTSQISRADVAIAVTRCLEDFNTIGKAMTITG